VNKLKNVPEIQSSCHIPIKQPSPIKLLTMAEASKLLRIPFHTLENWGSRT
jgi:hypothetical protein